MSVAGIEALTSLSGPAAAAASSRGPERSVAVEGPAGPSFGHLLLDGMSGLEAMHDRTDGLSVQAATGDLDALHQYTVASTETSVATQLTVAVRNKAVEAFNEIMRMQV